MGGDLKGVDQQLDYLRTMGVTAIYFNPIFDAGSNHSYDTQDYKQIDPYFGTQKDFDNLVKHAKALGIRIILDGVFNHMSSDSPLFDRYGHYSTVGACESTTSTYRSWFVFTDVAGSTLEQEKSRTGLSFGDVYVAHSLAMASHKSFNQIVALKAKGQGWAKIAQMHAVSLRGSTAALKEMLKQ